MIDILMATYNGEKYIEEQINSIINQDFKEWNLLIRDDCSTDNTINIINKYVEKYPDKIKLIDNMGKNLGVKLNFGELMKHSKSKYCMFADQDDKWLPNKISLTLEKMKELESNYGEEKPILIHTDLKVVDKNLELIDKSFWKYSYIDPSRNTLNKLLVKNTVTGCTMMINSSLKKLINFIPEECMMHDHWIALVASLSGIIYFIKEPTILYRQHENNQLGAKKKIKKKNFFRKRKLKYEFYVEQADILYKEFKNYLDKKNDRVLDDFTKIDKYNFFKRRYILIINNYFTDSVLSNIRMFLFC